MKLIKRLSKSGRYENLNKREIGDIVVDINKTTLKAFREDLKNIIKTLEDKTPDDLGAYLRTVIRKNFASFIANPLISL